MPAFSSSGCGSGSVWGPCGHPRTTLKGSMAPAHILRLWSPCPSPSPLHSPSAQPGALRYPGHCTGCVLPAAPPATAVVSARRPLPTAWAGVLPGRRLPPLPCAPAPGPSTRLLPSPQPLTLTQRMFEEVEQAGRLSQAGGAGGGTSWEAFVRAEQAWSRLRSMAAGSAAGPPPTFVTASTLPLPLPLPSSSTASSTPTPHPNPLAPCPLTSSSRPSPPAPQTTATPLPAPGPGPDHAAPHHPPPPPSSSGTGPHSAAPPPPSPLTAPHSLPSPSATAPRRCGWDVAVAGGTLGVFYAAGLALRGWRVLLLEGAALRGRQQEWNISRKELGELQQLGLFDDEDVRSALAVEFNPVRVSFHGAGEVWTRDVLNCGVRPDVAVQVCRRRLEALGGRVLEHTSLQGLTVHPEGVLLRLQSEKGEGEAGHAAPGGAPESQVTARLLLDCMGHGSPIVRQARWGCRPDGVCLVVGSLAAGFPNNTTGDVIATITNTQADDAELSKLQLFWEAFPAGSGNGDERTTYMFSYMDAESWRPSLLQLFEAYWPLLVEYQGVPLADLRVKRLLFGSFPTFRASPLQPQFDRVLQVGDASGIQSPLSFGGFGALARHLGRSLAAVDEALKVDALDAPSLSLINAYNPGLSSSWMMQRAMSCRPPALPPPDLINKMLGGNFAAQQELGEAVMKPFLQDVIQFWPLGRTLALQMVRDPAIIPRLLTHVGPGALLDWLRHVSALGIYTGLYALAGPLREGSLERALRRVLAPKQMYVLRRGLDAIEYGAGLDYRHGA